MNTPHLWLRAESKPGEARTPLTPGDAAALLQAGFAISVEQSSLRCFDVAQYRDAGCSIVETGSWPTAPDDAFILGLKELPETDAALIHRHIYFAHAFKDQQGWDDLLRRFSRGGGQLLDLEYLTDDSGRRVAAFGFWAGFAGAALAVLTLAGQRNGQNPALDAVSPWRDRSELLDACRTALAEQAIPTMLVIGALGRVGRGATELASMLDLPVTGWDLAETSSGGPFTEILAHDLFVNSVLASEPGPPFLDTASLGDASRRLRVIADVSCDPYSACNPLPIYEHCTSTDEPLISLSNGAAPLDLIAIDNLPSLLPRESSEDFSTQLLPTLRALADPDDAVWQRAKSLFDHHSQRAEHLS